MIVLTHEEAVALAERMGKWWLKGYKDGHAGKPVDCDAPKGSSRNDAYFMGYEAGRHDREVETRL